MEKLDRDTRLVARAINEGWPITQEQKALAVERLHQALETVTDTRDITRVVNALAKLNAQNMAQQALEHLGAEGTTVISVQEEIQAMLNTMPLLLETPEGGVSEAHHIEAQNVSDAHQSEHTHKETTFGEGIL